MYDQGAQASQLKFNNLFNEHFPSVFFCILCVKTGEMEVNRY